MLHVAVQRLGVARFGEAQRAIVTMETCIPFVAFGYGTAAAIAIGAERASAGPTGRILSSALCFKALHLVIVAAVALLVVTGSEPVDQWPLFFSAAILLVAATLETDFVHHGSQTVLIRNVFNMLAKVASVVGIVICVQTSADVLPYTLFACSPALLMAAASAVYNLRRYPWQWPARASLWPLFVRSVPFAVVVFLMTLIDRFDTLLANHLYGSRGTGFYNGQQRLVQGIASAAGAIGVVFFSEMVLKQDRARFTRHLNLSLWTMLALVAPVAAGVWFVDKPLLALVYGDEFRSEAYVLDWLSLAALLQVGIQAFGVQVLLIKQRTWLFNGIMGVAVVVGAGLSWRLGVAYGLAGIAFGSVAAKALACLLYALCARRYLESMPWASIGTACAPAVGMAAVLGLLRLDGLWENVAVGGAVFAVFFAAMNAFRISDLLKNLRRLRAQKRQGDDHHQ